MGRLDDKVAIITGAASGMGKSHAQRFVEEGAKVIIADIADEGEKVSDELGKNARFIKLDVTDEENWEKVVQKTEDIFGAVDVLVNNAGVSGPGVPIPEHTEKQFRNVTDINQLAVFLGMKAVYPSMKTIGEGSIINISSAAAFMGTPNTIAYTGTKFAIRGMTKVAAKEFGADGIRVNSVHPGPVGTGMFEVETQQKQAEALPIGRLGEEEEITNMVVYLASDESTYSTGSEFIVDGGMIS